MKNDQLSKLGFTIGGAPSLVNKSESNGLRSTDYVGNHQPLRKGIMHSARDLLEGQINKGGCSLAMPQTVRLSPHADERVEEGWEAEDKKSKAKADENFRQVSKNKHKIEEMDKMHGEEHHTDGMPKADVDYQPEEIDREFDGETRTAKRSNRDNQNAKDGEKAYGYKSMSQEDLFLKAMDDLEKGGKGSGIKGHKAALEQHNFQKYRDGQYYRTSQGFEEGAKKHNFSIGHKDGKFIVGHSVGHGAFTHESHDNFDDALAAHKKHLAAAHARKSMNVEKGGEGSRGGKIIGHTKSGKPIYSNASHASHSSFTDSDHSDAASLHSKKANRLARPHGEPIDPKQTLHREQAQSHSSKIKTKDPSVVRLSNSDSDISKALDSLIEMSQDPFDPELMANLHENSAEVRVQKREPEIVEKSFKAPPLKPSFVAKKPEKSPEEKKIQRKMIKEQEGDAEKSCKKSDIFDDLLKSIEDGPETPAAQTEAPKVVRHNLSPYKFVKSLGKGGIMFDFGSKTGNPMADNATALLQETADPMQNAAAAYQDKSYTDALQSFVVKGEHEFEAKETNAKVLEKGFDQQVKESYENGTLYQDHTAPAVKNEFNKSELRLGGEAIKATSPTDAALIEMMKGQMQTEDTGGVVVDATNGGKVSVTVDC